MAIVESSPFDSDISRRELFHEYDAYYSIIFPSQHGSTRGLYERVVRGGPRPQVAPFRIDRRGEVGFHFDALHPLTCRGIAGNLFVFIYIIIRSYY